jgi:hypothetical protein
MSSFLSDLDTRYVGTHDEDLFQLLAPYVYQSDVAGITIEVPAGFLTDFSSVPRIPLAYWLTGGKAKQASVVHDFLCETKLVSRQMADEVFLEIMELTNVPVWRQKVMWAGVRAYASFTGKDGPPPPPDVNKDIYFG